MNPDEIKNLLQVLLTMLGGVLMSHGVVTGTDWTMLSGALLGLVGPVWSIVGHWNMRKVPETAKIVGGAILLALALGLASPPVSAANLAPPMATKARAPVGYNYDGGGLYAGIGAVGDVAGSSQFGATVYSPGAALEFLVGYQFALPNKSNWGAIEVAFDYQNIGSAQPCTFTASCAMSSTFGFEQRFMFGFPIDVALAALPNLGNFFPALAPRPACPAGQTCSTGTAHPYIFGGLLERKFDTTFNDIVTGSASSSAWKLQPEFGLGMLHQWTAGLVDDTSAGCTIGNVGIQIGGLPARSATLTRDCRAKIALKY